MNQDIIKKLSDLSDQERMAFPELIFKLRNEGIESYYADVMCSEKTYYSNTESFSLQSLKHTHPISDIFDAEKLVDAIRASQSGQIKYKEFIKRACEAGVFSYFVFIKGNKAIYFGKNGDQHIENFPQE